MPFRFELFVKMYQPNTPHDLIHWLGIDVANKIGSYVGSRCQICEEGVAVPTRIHWKWEWFCMTCSLCFLPPTRKMFELRDIDADIDASSLGYIDADLRVRGFVH
jgi:hypothetical protein